MTVHVFAYGSLMFPEVWTRVVRGQYRHARAVAQGYARYGVAGQTYPGMIAEPGASVCGVVYFDVDARDLAALDAFEGDDYRRIAVRLQGAGGAGMDADTGTNIDAGIDAQTYLYLPRGRLTSEIWLPETFPLQRFIETYCREKLGE